VTPIFGFNSVTFWSTNKKVQVTITITEAYYTDIDKDEVLDVISSFNILYDSSRPHLVIFYVSLILPSGWEFSYKWFILSKQSVYYGQIYFYDHALESGNYILSINAKLLTGGVTTATLDYEFDPPGGAGGGDPLACLI
ncbi:MAG: hypothetical protein ACFFDT_28110, partial [Candidatus Hodarchaeota archaeon]